MDVFYTFFQATRHAIDLECPVSTPVLAVADGTVVEVKQDNVVSGIHASNLYKWNSIMLKLDDGQFVEYVHIETNSAIVKVGDHVQRGHICNSGDVGFCPPPICTSKCIVLTKRMPQLYLLALSDILAPMRYILLKRVTVLSKTYKKALMGMTLISFQRLGNFIQSMGSTALSCGN